MGKTKKFWEKLLYSLLNLVISVLPNIGQGTCSDIPANDWDSYMPVADHPEYPSLTASVCAAYSEASRDFLGNDETGLEPVPFIQGNSRREFGLTPRRNTSINIDTWTE